jgi:hypothetical protein
MIQSTEGRSFNTLGVHLTLSVLLKLPLRFVAISLV